MEQSNIEQSRLYILHICIFTYVVKSYKECVDILSAIALGVLLIIMTMLYYEIDRMF